MLLSETAPSLQRQLARCLGHESSWTEFDRRMRLIESLRTLRMIHHSAWIAWRCDPAFRVASQVRKARSTPWTEQATPGRAPRPAQSDGRGAADRLNDQRPRSATSSALTRRTRPPDPACRPRRAHRLVEQDLRQGRRNARSIPGRFPARTRRSLPGWAWRPAPPAQPALSMRARWPLMSPSSTTRQAGESTRRW